MIDRFLLSRLESLCESFKSSEGGQRRDCVICSVSLSLHSANPTDSPSLASMLVGQCFYSDAGACGGKTLISRLNLCPSATCRARTGLPPMAFAVSFRIRFADAKTAVKPHRLERTDGRFRIGAVVTVVPRPTAVHHGYIYIESVRRYSCYFTALLPMCIRLT